MDLKPEDTLYWMTGMGWMRGPWEVFGTLLNGATLLFDDGGPDDHGVDRMWSLVERPRAVRFVEALPKTCTANREQPVGDLHTLEDPGTQEAIRAAL